MLPHEDRGARIVLPRGLDILPSTSRVPEVVATLVCQALIMDQQTQTRTLVNVLQELQLFQIPGAVSLGLYVKMVEGSGSYRCKVRFVRMSDDAVIIDVPEQQLEWPESSPALELGMNFGNLVIEAAGLYEFQVFMNDMYMGRAVLGTKLFVPPVQ